MTLPARFIVGDAVSVLDSLPAESVNCAVTSPPYWGLRDYGVPASRWPTPLGLEPTPDLYVAHLVEVFSALWRVLRSDGTLWLNLGDCYATGAGSVGEHPGGGAQGERWKGYRGTRGGSPKHADGAIGPMTQPNRMPIPGLKPKDLVGVPWRVAFALQAAGWWLRSDVVWSKPNPMPESVQDRPTKAHEFLFLLSKAERYYYDADAIKEPADRSASGNKTRRLNDGERQRVNNHRGTSVPWEGETRNRRSVWTITPSQYPGPHFATFPPELIEPCILAGCPAGGVVLDPFAGTFTVGVVATGHGRDAIGIDLDERNAELARARVGMWLDVDHHQEAASV